MKTIGAVSAVLAIAVISAFTPVHAAPTASAAAETSATSGIGFGNTPNQSTTIMYSAPNLGTYVVGIAHAGDNLADLCWAVGSDGFAWDLVLERNGWGGDHDADTAAFIPERELASQAQRLWCGNITGYNAPGLGLVPKADPIGSVGMSSAPYVNTHIVGTESSGDLPFAAICSVVVNGIRWDMVLDYDGRAGDHLPYTTGFVGDGSLNPGFGIGNDC